MRAVLASVALALVACTPDIPEGKLECIGDDDCPDDWHCLSDQRCYSDPEGERDAGPSDAETDATTDAGIDSSVDSGLDATPGDTGTDVTPDSADASAESCVLDVPTMNGRMLVPAASELWPAEFTWEMWIRFDSFDEDATSRLFFVTATGGGDGLFYMRRFMGALECVIGGGGGVSVASATPAMELGVWHHVACTREETGISLYLDGEMEASAAGTPFSPPTTDIGIGGDYRTPPEFSGDFVGAIDDVRVSNIVRYTDSFDPELELTADGATVALWKFSECSGTTAADESAMYMGALLDGSGFGIRSDE